MNVRSFCYPLQLVLLSGALLSWLGQTAVAQADSGSAKSLPAVLNEVAPPDRFERILWCADSKLGPELARKWGYTAVQLGRGGDAAHGAPPPVISKSHGSCASRELATWLQHALNGRL